MKAEPEEEPGEDSSAGKEDSGNATDSPAKEIGNRLRGLFGL